MPFIEYEKPCTLYGQQAVLRSFTLNTTESRKDFATPVASVFINSLMNTTQLHHTTTITK
jgi:hypothetical protein